MNESAIVSTPEVWDFPNAENDRPPDQASDTQKGDLYLIEALKLEPILQSVLNRFTKCSSEVPDLIQETYYRILRSVRTNTANVNNLKAFALHVARNVAIDWLRSQESRIVDFCAEPDMFGIEDTEADAEGIAAANEDLEALAEAVMQLPPRCRQAFTLRRVYGLRQSEVAEHMHTSEHTVEQQIAKAARLIAHSMGTVGCQCRGVTLRHPFLRRFRL